MKLSSGLLERRLHEHVDFSLEEQRSLQKLRQEAALAIGGLGGGGGGGSGCGRCCVASRYQNFIHVPLQTHGRVGGLVATKRLPRPWFELSASQPLLSDFSSCAFRPGATHWQTLQCRA